MRDSWGASKTFSVVVLLAAQSYRTHDEWEWSNVHGSVDH